MIFVSEWWCDDENDADRDADTDIQTQGSC